VRGSWQQINSVLDSALRAVSLADMLNTPAPAIGGTKNLLPRRTVAAAPLIAAMPSKTGEVITE